MLTVLTHRQVIVWIERTAEVMKANRDTLTELDAAIGDADHGNNMDRGYQAAVAKLPGDETDVGAILRSLSMALISKVGGAAGPLYGTFFLQASNALKGRTELTEADVERLLETGIDGVMMRGKAQAGEKTMLDALIPARDAFATARGRGASLTDCLEAATEAAGQGMRATIPMIATKGRASYLGERSRGHQDPGATSSYLILKTLTEIAQEGRTAS
ncbi:dihydroxyacetone kinase subunit DhaL [Imhoffiella purpurea]|uniref:Phosphoenolpyruvate-dihydroxyacetone phosphotransferase, ADP-binding subunit DhaL n=1 Tax=Imhoffiella purpurea TaxID=1249627 RepID=W9VBV4_9GAMM|nr:dihydroxyacetone kinase subunit DhaL [Imhoffiella purpurea]EXJ14451.1 Phosphoenolpyruvate-dihydroxyacetone phosphotransferase, ADP-binding subunit DhaL [Imhoffiella purpurea]